MNESPNRRRRFLAALVGTPVAAWLGSSPAARASASMEVWKDPNCGCCNKWVDYLRKAGLTVTTHDIGNAAARARAGIEKKYGSCHTALVEGYAVEGHVPLREIERLLKERPEAIGLAVPGMPIGSPGMEMGKRVEPYAVLLLHRDGSSSDYAKYGSEAPRGGAS